jgi:methylated-DNA-[protein]-cysteine S-methyltransferase
VKMMREEISFRKKVAAWLGDEKVAEEKEPLLTELDLLYASGPDDQRISAAVEGLKDKLAHLSSQILYYGVMEDTPIGSVYIAISNQRVIAIDIGVTEDQFISRLRRKFTGKITHSSEKIAGVIEQLQEYFEGKRSSFKLDLDLDELSQFQRRVLLATLKIPRGEITTYGEMAKRLGKAQWARAVGQALARNPIPIVIPCHRVLAADGSLHGYSGGKGIETKAELLKLEGAFPA